MAPTTRRSNPTTAQTTRVSTTRTTRSSTTRAIHANNPNRRANTTRITRASTAQALHNPNSSESSDGVSDIPAKKRTRRYSPTKDATLYQSLSPTVNQPHTRPYMGGDRSAKRPSEHSGYPIAKRQRTYPSQSRKKAISGIEEPLVVAKEHRRPSRDPYSLDAIGEDDQSEYEASEDQDEHGADTDQDGEAKGIHDTPASKNTATTVPDGSGTPPDSPDPRQGSSPSLVELTEVSSRTSPRPSIPSGDEEPNEYFNPPEDTQDVPLAPVKSSHFHLLLDHMGRAEWTGNGKLWQTELSSGEELPNKNISQGDIDQIQWIHWYNKHKPGRYKQMIQYIYRLRCLCRQVPTASNPEEQVDHLGQKATVAAFRQTIHPIALYVDNTTTKFATLSGDSNQRQRKRAENDSKSLSNMVIPLLCLVLKEIFVLGASQSREERLEGELDSLPMMGKFSASLLQTMLQITGWIGMLCGDVVIEQRVRPQTNAVERKLNRLALPMRYIERFKGDVRNALDNLDEVANGHIRRQLAMENDKRLKQEREEKLRKEREEKDLQWQMHLASTQRMTRCRTSSPPPTVPRPTPAMPSSSQTRHLSEKEGYAARNGGWYWDEDNRLLTTIRRVPQPDFTVLANVIRGRSAEEVRQRAKELKEIIRRKYEMRNMPPPRWCIS